MQYESRLVEACLDLLWRTQSAQKPWWERPSYVAHRPPFCILQVDGVAMDESAEMQIKIQYPGISADILDRFNIFPHEAQRKKDPQILFNGIMWVFRIFKGISKIQGKRRWRLWRRICQFGRL